MKEKMARGVVKEFGCANGRLKCEYLGRMFVSDFCGRFNRYLTSQGHRCPECRKALELDDIKTRSGRPVYTVKPVSTPKAISSDLS